MSALAPSTTADFAQSLPPPLTSLLIELAPAISWLSWSLQAATWQLKGRRAHSWLFVAAWWALCLLSRQAVRYYAPILLFLALALPWPKRKPPLATEDTVQRAVNDLQIIRTAISRPLFIVPSFNFQTAIRVTLFAALPYLVLCWALRTRVLLALCGTVLLISRAHWFIVVRRTLWESAFVRWTSHKLWQFLSGERPLTIRRQSLGSREPQNITSLSTTEVRMLFTILENQRWWVGLDFTAALFPGERPSWCSQSLQPASPPNSYSLPNPTSSYLPHPQNPKIRLQRVAEWRWEEPEWKVNVAINQGSATQRVEKPVPSGSPAVVEGTKTLKIKELKEGVSDAKTRTKEMIERSQGEGNADALTDSSEQVANEDRESAECTDAEGWIYGDNKWDNQSAKGGIGKYTRYRRWARIAVLSEKVQEVGPGSMGVIRTSPASGLLPMEVNRKAVSSNDMVVTSPTQVTGDSVSPTSPIDPDVGDRGADRLRQRLKAAVRSSTASMG